MNTPILSLTLKSIANRRFGFALTLCSIALAVALLLGIERLRDSARDNFANTLSGVDLVVGARGGPVQILLYSVFHLGAASNEISWHSVRTIAAQPQVAWVVPIALGDSHRGFRVVGTTADYFRHYQYGDRQSLRLAEGRMFGEGADAIFEAVIGAEVAQALGYRPGAQIVLAHGDSGHGAEHDDKPFTVVGVLARSGTPTDRSVLISLAGIEALHLDWVGGVPMPGLQIPAEAVRKFDLQPKTVTALLVGLKSRVMVFQLQRWINGYRDEPLSAVLPGVALQELWSMLGVVEQALLAMSALVVVVGLAGLVAVMIASLNERRRELAILRALGASPGSVFRLLMLESLLLGTLGCLAGLAGFYALALTAAPILTNEFGLMLSLGPPSLRECALLGAVLGAALLASLIPGWRAYRYSLADGLTIRQ